MSQQEALQAERDSNRNTADVSVAFQQPSGCQSQAAPGSLPGLRNGTKAQPRAMARGAPKMRPRASKPACWQWSKGEVS